MVGANDSTELWCPHLLQKKFYNIDPQIGNSLEISLILASFLAGYGFKVQDKLDSFK